MIPGDEHDWTDEQWQGRSRMAAARRHAGVELDAIDRTALERWPEEYDQ